MNNQLRFDPMTGKPLNNTQQIPQQQMPNQVNTSNQVPGQQVLMNHTAIQQPTIQMQATQSFQPNQQSNIQQQMQAIPTVGQNMQEFINNTQTNSEVKTEEKNNKPNILLIVIIFAVIFAAIFFLFPYLLDVLG